MISLSSQISQIIAAWSIPFFGGWSIMSIFGLFLVLSFVASVVSYFYDKGTR